MRILIKNGTIVNANGRERKDILTDGDRIIAIGGNLDAAGAEVIDAAGCYVMPGFIDTTPKAPHSASLTSSCLKWQPIPNTAAIC